jgi:hypothetical protein
MAGEILAISSFWQARCFRLSFPEPSDSFPIGKVQSGPPLRSIFREFKARGAMGRA